jgi:hypothetical protein
MILIPRSQSERVFDLVDRVQTDFKGFHFNQLSLSIWHSGLILKTSSIYAPGPLRFHEPCGRILVIRTDWLIPTFERFLQSVRASFPGVSFQSLVVTVCTWEDALLVQSE